MRGVQTTLAAHVTDLQTLHNYAAQSYLYVTAGTLPMQCNQEHPRQHRWDTSAWDTSAWSTTNMVRAQQVCAWQSIHSHTFQNRNVLHVTITKKAYLTRDLGVEPTPGHARAR